MEIPTNKKGFPWKWVAVGCGVVTIAVIALVVIAILAVVPGIRTTIIELNRERLNSSTTRAILA